MISQLTVPLGIVLDNNLSSGNHQSLLANKEYNYALVPVTNKNFENKCLTAQQHCGIITDVANSDLFNIADTSDTSSGNCVEFNPELDHHLAKFITPYPDVDDSVLPLISQVRPIVGMLSSWINLECPGDLGFYNFRILHNEIEFAHFLGVKSFIMPMNPKVKKIQSLSTAITRLLHLFPSVKISLDFQIDKDQFDLEMSYQCLRIWNIIKIQCENNQNLSVALSNIPSNSIDIWLSEPIRFFLLSADDLYCEDEYLKERLSKTVITVTQLNILTPTVIAIKSFSKESNNFDNYVEFEFCKKYIDSVLRDSKHIDMVSPLFLSAVENVIKAGIPRNILFSSDLLQEPMKPFAENLENAMYSEFEKDTHKYDQYERAFMKALIDLTRNQPSEEKKHVLFVGPGRGPLIDRFFLALSTLSISPSRFVLTAIERNYSLISVLHEKNRIRWNGTVNILCMDSSMYPQSKHNKEFGKVHLVVSELMGSFGCNELMPECIDSIAIPEVCSADCIFIPCSIESYIAPVTAPLLWKIASEKRIDYPMEQIYIPLVPFLKSHEHVLTWSFQSRFKARTNIPEGAMLDLRLSNYYNSRQFTSSFSFQAPTTIDGLAGYFIATLYPGFKPIAVSNFDPPPNERGCISWLPAYFPFTKSIYVDKGYTLEVSMTRNCNGNMVWYEWSAIAELQRLGEDPVSIAATKLHNTNGRSFKFVR